MVSLVLTNRNRDLQIVKKCLESLHKQTNNGFDLFFVDYGSDPAYVIELQKILQEYPRIKQLLCPVYGQLWNKSRAINSALKLTNTPYFLVGDVDLIFAPHFIAKVYELMNEKEIWYFQYGFLSPEESVQIKEFDEYVVDFKGSNAVTGTTLFPTAALKKLNGYDEFYHGWGAEDTDIHVRLQHSGFAIVFYDEQIVIKHQWHAKQYRNKQSTHPFHAALEQINHDYLQLAKATKRTLVNRNFKWGLLGDPDIYQGLRTSKFDYKILIENSNKEVAALLAQLNNFENETLHVIITSVGLVNRIKSNLKKYVTNKSCDYLDMEKINSLILEDIIKFHRNIPYHYNFDRRTKSIELKMIFQKTRA